MTLLSSELTQQGVFSGGSFWGWAPPPPPATKHQTVKRAQTNSLAFCLTCTCDLQRLKSPLYVVHANFVGGGFKRHRFRETQLWQYDTPAYYNVQRLLSFDMHTLQPPADWQKLSTKHRVRFHLENIATQLQQVTHPPWHWHWHWHRDFRTDIHDQHGILFAALQ